MLLAQRQILVENARLKPKWHKVAVQIVIEAVSSDKCKTVVREALELGLIADAYESVWRT